MSSLADAAQAGRMCSSWLEPSRRRLYTDLVFRSNSDHAESLARTLTTSPHIRVLIRRLKLIERSRSKDAIPLYDWLYHLPPDGLRTLSIDHLFGSPGFATDVLACPALSGVQRLDLKGDVITSARPLEVFLALPSLESLALPLHFVEDKIHISTISTIKHLRISTFKIDENAINLLIALQQSLTWLDLHVTEWAKSGDGERALLPVLKGMCNLQHLAVDAPYLAYYPFMDGVLPHLPALRYVHCSYGTWSAALFVAIQVPLSILSLRWNPRIPFPIDAALDAIHRKRSHLQSIVLVDQSDPDILGRLRDACSCEGVHFHVEDEFHLTDQIGV
jgi:hypothetical protein